jgi:hypothetical protein
MKKIKLLIVAVAMLSLVSSSAVYADGFAPGEGLYVGAFFGHTAGHLSAKGTYQDYTGQLNTHELTEGGIGLSGVEGGGYLGYGYKMGDLYIGFEGGMAAGGPEFEATSTKDIEVGANDQASAGVADYTFNRVSAEAKYTANVGGRIGYYVNADSLLSFSGGMAASEFDATWGAFSETYYAGGPRFSAQIESRLSAIDPNLSVRVETHFTDYMKASVNAIGTQQGRDGLNDTELSGQAYGGRIGLQYSFFDANSLF